MVKKWICCVVVISLVTSFTGLGFAEEQTTCKMLKLVEAKEIDIEQIESCSEECCSARKKEDCERKRFVIKLKMKFIRFCDLTQKVASHIKMPDLKNIKIIRILIQYLEKEQVSIA